MLSSMRKKKKWLNIVLWIVILAFLATIVVVWGIGDQVSETSYVAKVGDYTVTQNEYRNFYNNTQTNMRASGQMPESTAEFDRIVMDEIINRQLFMQEAKRLKLRVTDAEVANVITADPTFYGNNGFDTAKYQEILIANGLTPNTYEENIRSNLMINKAMQMALSTVAVTPDEIKREYNYGYSDLSASYFTVTPSAYMDSTQPDELQLTAYYEANAERWRQAPRIKLKYIKFTDSDFEFTPNITDEDLQNRYTANIVNYTTPETLDLSQIMMFVPDMDNASALESVRQRMESALSELDNGTSFADVAAKYSEDGNAGQIGLVTRPENIDDNPMLQQIFALKAGEHSMIITSDFGLHVYMANSRTDAVVQSFDDIKEVIRLTMEEEAISNAYRNHNYNIFRTIMSAGNITAYVAQNPDKYEVIELDYLSEDDPNAFFQSESDLKELLFSLTRTEITPMMDRADGAYIYELEDRINTRIPPLSEITDTVTADFKADSAYDKALAAVENTVTTTGINAEDFAKTAAQFNAPLNMIPTFKRIDANAAMSWAGALVDLLFSSKNGDVVIYPQRDSKIIYVVFINELKAPEEAGLAAVSTNIENSLLAVKQADTLEAVLKYLRTQHPVVINPTFEPQR